MQENIEITNFSNFKTKAFAKYFYEFNGDIRELKKVIDFAKKNNLNILPISAGTNMLFAFDIFNGLVIRFSDYKLSNNYVFSDYLGIRGNIINTKFNYKGGILEVSAFENISDVAEVLYRENISKKWMRFIGLPGKIAGAVVGNAGCFGLEIENHLLKIEALNLDNLNIEILNKYELSFSYRNSIIKKERKYIVLKAWFNLNLDNEKYSYNGSLDDIIYFRTQKQPSGNTCGSFFKNPSKEMPAGKLIEKVGLKGYKLGGAYFSSKHANFLMSDGTATWKDLISLKDLAKEKVKNKFGLNLEEEVFIVN